MMMLLIVIECSSLSLKNTAANCIIVPFLFAVVKANAIDIDNAPQLFQSSCGMCHTGGGNSLPFSKGKTLSASDLKANGYNNVDNIVSIINKVIITILLLSFYY